MAIDQYNLSLKYLTILFVKYKFTVGLYVTKSDQQIETFVEEIKNEFVSINIPESSWFW